MLDIIFFSALCLYLLSVIGSFAALAFHKEKITKLANIVFLAAFVLNSAYMLARGITAGRLPLSNQFEFATAFTWGIGLMALILRKKIQEPWFGATASAAAFLVLSFAALQPRSINELMPALRSAWFGLHIGSAVFSYSAFTIAACLSIRYLSLQKKVGDEDERLFNLDYLSYRLIAFGFLLLTVVIISGCIWAEQAWSAFWTWDPKETWALITWIIYSVYLHLRLRRKWQGKRMAIFAIVALVCVLFTFFGVNVLFSGLHSYK